MPSRSLIATQTAQRWRVHGVSVQGHSHLRDGVECQDAHRHVAAGGVHVLAVADGAGSRRRSAEGAALAVGLATELLAARVHDAGPPADAEGWRALLAAGYEEIVTAFLASTARLARDPREFAATLTAVVIAHPWAGVVSIGDGFVVARTQGRVGEAFHLVRLADPDGEYVNETVFLTSAGARSEVSISCLYDPALTGVVLGTDGLVPAAVRRRNGRRRANDSFLEPLLGSLDAPTDIARLLLDERITALSADDKTLLMAVPA
jgi:Protein phosphatase 2C